MNSELLPACNLDRTVAHLNEIERRRAALIRQAVHDLRSSVQSVSTAAEVLRAADIADAERVKFATLVQQGIEAVNTMVNELMELARLEAGQETRTILAFDAARLLLDLCATARPLADARRLFLTTTGVSKLPVAGDASKVRRLVQNLLFNALKYTDHGGVTVSWGVEEESWWVTVADTGPGLGAGLGTPVAAKSSDATQAAREGAVKSARTTGEKSPIQRGGAIPAIPEQRQKGEGIGLSIVQRICELLDARLELATGAGRGTTFRVVFPRTYLTETNWLAACA